jgi:pilus assembly protein CpaF
VFSLLITERGGAQRQLEFDAAELSIGRLEDNDVVLPRTNVSKRHARLGIKEDRYLLLDLGSTNGTYVNGRRITAPVTVGTGDKIYIGDFILALQHTPRVSLAQQRLRERPPTQPAPRVAEPLAEPGLGALQSEAPAPPRRSGPPPPPPAPRPRAPAPTTEPPPPLQGDDSGPVSLPPRSSDLDERPTAEGVRRVLPPPSQRPPTPPARSSAPPPRSASVPPRVQDPESGQGPATSPAVLAPSVRLQGALQSLMERLGSQMDVTEPYERAFPSECQPLLEAQIDTLASEGVLGPDLDRRFLTQAAVSEAVGLGPLDRLLTNRSVREVVVDGPSRILADLGGGLSPVSSFFSSTRSVETALKRLYARAGKKLGPGPIDEVLLPDGSQVTVLLPPLAASGPLISIRCPVRSSIAPDGLVTEGVLSVDMLRLLRAAVQKRLNVLIVGPMANGVSSLLAALASLSHDHERIVTLQQAPSLAIAHPHVLPLNLAAVPGQDLGELLRHAARLRADRLVIDDLPAKDALAALMGAASLRGVLIGMHAPSPATALEQLEMFAQVALGGARGSLAALIAQAFQLLVHVSLDSGGARRVLSIAELRGAHGSTLDLATLYRYDNGFKATDQRASFG